MKDVLFLDTQLHHPLLPGVYDEGPFQAYVDLQNVPELHEKRMESDHLTVGGSVSLAELIQILRKAGTSGNPGYSYGQAVADHLEKVGEPLQVLTSRWTGL